MLGVFIRVAFLTLIERKIIRYTQSRKGPNKINFNGLLQPFSDGLKLFCKEMFLSKFSKFYFFVSRPLLGLFLIRLLWMYYPNWSITYYSTIEILFFFSLMSLTSYFLFFCGFRTVRMFSIIGYVRSISQVISYEVCIIIFLLLLIFRFKRLTFSNICFWEGGLRYLVFLPFSFYLWLLIILSESNRSPFDFSEGESELVSGFNTEYFGGLFSIIFITEYGMLIFIRFISSWLFIGNLYLTFSILFFAIIYVLCRCRYPRYRYDKLIEVSWLRVSPLILSIIIIIIEFLFNA